MNRKNISSLAVFALASTTLAGLAGCGTGGEDNKSVNLGLTASPTVSPSPVTSPSPRTSPSPSPSPSPSSPPNVGTVTTASGLKYQDLVVGVGAVAQAGQRATVTYVGTLENGTEFDRGTFSFNLGANAVVAGFDEGVTGMAVGGRRRLIIPANLGYGNNPPAGSNIPANATLIFDVTLDAVAAP